MRMIPIRPNVRLAATMSPGDNWRDIAAAFVKGMEVSRELLFEQCRAQEIESAMRRHQPHLYEEGG